MWVPNKTQQEKFAGKIEIYMYTPIYLYISLYWITNGKKDDKSKV